MFSTSSRSVRGAVLISLVLVMLASLVGPAGAQSNEERRLEATKAKLQNIRAQIETAKTRQSKDADRLAVAERQLAEVQQAVGEAEQAVQRQQQQVAEARQELQRLQDEAAEQNKVMAERAVTLYMQGTGVPFEAILASDSPQDALARSAYVDVVTRSDRRQIEGLDASQVAIDAQREYLEREEETLRRVLAEREVVLAQVREIRNDRAIALAESRNQVAQLEQQETHLESEARQVEAMARRASQTARQAASRSSSGPAPTATAASVSEPAPSGGGGSGWVWPARGPVTSEYGPRWGRMHNGLDIGAPTGAPIYAAKAGTVSYAGSMSGYGNMTMIDHGGGIVTAYAHQSAIMVSPGTRVGAGQRIGSIGCTGSCTGPHLHFEVRVNGSARNPRGYLP
jgi:septal ring factor EnvC (AmiA/AmiB activator)